jgi:predicted short-subunit dehydrogenase-like oxidoreductase (DUF2520 family)
LQTAAAIAGVETPAIGAWMIGRLAPIRCNKVDVACAPVARGSRGFSG